MATCSYHPWWHVRHVRSWGFESRTCSMCFNWKMWQDIRVHLKAIGVSDSSLDEARLLLAWAGQCIRNSIFSLDRNFAEGYRENTECYYMRPIKAWFHDARNQNLMALFQCSWPCQSVIVSWDYVVSWVKFQITHSRRALSAIFPRGASQRYLRWLLRENLNLKRPWNNPRVRWKRTKARTRYFPVQMWVV